MNNINAVTIIIIYQKINIHINIKYKFYYALQCYKKIYQQQKAIKILTISEEYLLLCEKIAQLN